MISVHCCCVLCIECQYRSESSLPIYSCDNTYHVIAMPTKTRMSLPFNLTRLGCQHEFKGRGKRGHHLLPPAHGVMDGEHQSADRRADRRWVKPGNDTRRGESQHHTSKTVLIIPSVSLYKCHNLVERGN